MTPSKSSREFDISWMHGDSDPGSRSGPSPNPTIPDHHQNEMSRTRQVIHLLGGVQFREIFRAIRRTTPAWLFRSGRAHIFELNKQTYLQDKRPHSFPRDYSARYVSRDELPAVAAVGGVIESECFRRFDYGDKCFAVFQASRPTNINWIHYGTCYVRGLGYIHLGQRKDAYIYNIFTDPAQRGKGLYKNALIRLSDELFQSGSELLVQMVEEGNAPVLHTLPKLGYAATKTILHVSLWRIKYTLVRNVADDTINQRLFMNPPPDVFFI